MNRVKHYKCTTPGCKYEKQVAIIKPRFVTDTTFEWPHVFCCGCGYELIFVREAEIVAVSGG